MLATVAIQAPLNSRFSGRAEAIEELPYKKISKKEQKDITKFFIINILEIIFTKIKIFKKKIRF